MSAEQNEARGPAQDLAAWMDHPLPCDVHLPPNSYIRKGCSVQTLLLCLSGREGKPDEITTFPKPESGESVHNRPRLKTGEKCASDELVRELAEALKEHVAAFGCITFNPDHHPEMETAKRKAKSALRKAGAL